MASRSSTHNRTPDEIKRIADVAAKCGRAIAAERFGMTASAVTTLVKRHRETLQKQAENA